MKDYVIGVDLGGTNLRAGLVRKDQPHLPQKPVSRPIAVGHSARQNKNSVDQEIERVLDEIVAIVPQVLESTQLKINDIQGIGIAVPDPVTADGFLPIGCTTLIGWDGLDIKGKLLEKLQKTGVQNIWVGNDANAHALGELHFGQGKNLSEADIVYLAVGTGIGCGLIFDGKLRVGFSGCAGEWGHIVIDPSGPSCWGCERQRGCLETFASGTAIAYHASTAINENKVPALREYVSTHGQQVDSEEAVSISSMPTNTGRYVTARMIIDLAKGNPSDSLTQEALSFVTKAGEYLGHALVQIMHSVNPRQIIVGGSIVNAGEAYLEPARKWAGKNALPSAFTNVEITASSIKEEAGILGAASAVLYPESVR